MIRIGTESLENVRKPSFRLGSSYSNFFKSASSRVMLHIDEEDDIYLYIISVIQLNFFLIK